ncbi:hypothetical protein ASA1KI_34220 [Opitutales bacterium ASA1]|uniref:EamA family transporter n=1 Tax=Congregicoccus parvus TaxID=3081749 RepID=UPI002B282FB0|nr:hypothetical protein ASA1KI_34220 [Opitutales bacterium ASA1]
MLLGERPSPLALGGGAVIVVGVFVLTGGTRLIASVMRRPTSGSGETEDATRLVLYSSLRYGVASGLFIAAYTLWDHRGVSSLAIAPVLYDAGTAMTQLVLLAPFARRRGAELAHHWREHRRWVLGVALLAPAAYILVLTAMRLTPVSYIAPAREIGILFGAFLGVRLLREAHGYRRVAAAALVVCGVIALAVG